MESNKQDIILILIILQYFGGLSSQTFYGNYKGYEYVPTNIPDGITDLHLYGNKITELNDTSFNYSDFSRVRRAKIESNRIRNITKRAFEKFASLETLELSHNKLTTFEMTSHYYPNLATLEIISNKLSTLPKFNGYFGKLRYLYLNSNNIKYVYAQDFENITNLYYLNLYRNGLLAFESFYQKNNIFK